MCEKCGTPDLLFIGHDICPICRENLFSPIYGIPALIRALAYAWKRNNYNRYVDYIRDRILVSNILKLNDICWANNIDENNREYILYFRMHEAKDMLNLW